MERFNKLPQLQHLSDSEYAHLAVRIRDQELAVDPKKMLSMAREYWKHKQNPGVAMMLQGCAFSALYIPHDKPDIKKQWRSYGPEMQRKFTDMCEIYHIPYFYVYDPVSGDGVLFVLYDKDDIEAPGHNPKWKNTLFHGKSGIEQSLFVPVYECPVKRKDIDLAETWLKANGYPLRHPDKWKHDRLPEYEPVSGETIIGDGYRRRFCGNSSRRPDRIGRCSD